MMKLHKLPSISHRFALAVQRAGLIICLFALAGCADKEVRLSGDREDVLSYLRTLVIDGQASAELAGLANAVVNNAFGHPGVTPAQQYLQADQLFARLTRHHSNGRPMYCHQYL